MKKITNVTEFIQAFKNLFAEESQGTRQLDIITVKREYDKTTKKVFIPAASIPAMRNINIGDVYSELEAAGKEFIWEKKIGAYFLRDGVGRAINKSGLEWTISYEGGTFFRAFRQMKDPEGKLMEGRFTAISLFIKPDKD